MTGRAGWLRFCPLATLAGDPRGIWGGEHGLSGQLASSTVLEGTDQRRATSGRMRGILEPALSRGSREASACSNVRSVM